MHIPPSPRESLAEWFKQLQAQVCEMLQAFEPEAAFDTNMWTYAAGRGGGCSKVLRGSFLEKAGVSVSCIEGTCSPGMLRQLQLTDTGTPVPFWVSGISIIVHPFHPHAPSIHFNTRCFVTEHQHWFGGGTDLTPMLEKQRAPDDADGVFFHQALRDVCQTYYPEETYHLYKTQCDQYFYLPHRHEGRGIGGIFYDHVHTQWDTDVAFTQALGRCFVETYRTLLARHHQTPWDAAERQEQLHWRARYAEFNLLYDRGTRFGLEAGGNVEAILSSMPPAVCW